MNAPASGAIWWRSSESPRGIFAQIDDTMCSHRRLDETPRRLFPARFVRPTELGEWPVITVGRQYFRSSLVDLVVADCRSVNRSNYGLLKQFIGAQWLIGYSIYFLIRCHTRASAVRGKTRKLLCDQASALEQSSSHLRSVCTPQ